MPRVCKNYSCISHECVQLSNYAKQLNVTSQLLRTARKGVRRVCRRLSSSTPTSSHTNYGTTKQSPLKDADSVRLSTSLSLSPTDVVVIICRLRHHGPVTDDTTSTCAVSCRRVYCPESVKTASLPACFATLLVIIVIIT